MKEIHIHAGMGRSGSSAIQHFLRDDVGPSSSIVYPTLALSALKGAKASGNITYMVKALAGHPADSTFCSDMMDELIEILTSCDDRKIVLSAEGTFGLSESHLSLLRIELERVAKTTCHIYVRDLYDWHLSVYRQRVKSRCWTIEASDYLSSAYKPGKVIQRLANFQNAFGDSLNCYPYGRSYFPDGDVRRHFLEAIGAGDEDITFSGNEVNASGNTFELEVMRRCNALATDGRWSSRANRRLLNALHNHRSGEPDLGRLVDPEVEAKLRAAAEPEMQEITARFLSGQRPTSSPERGDYDPGNRKEVTLVTLDIVLGRMRVTNDKDEPNVGRPGGAKGAQGS